VGGAEVGRRGSSLRVCYACRQLQHAAVQGEAEDPEGRKVLGVRQGW
jgi:hypothetical protein